MFDLELKLHDVHPCYMVSRCPVSRCQVSRFQRPLILLPINRKKCIIQHIFVIPKYGYGTIGEKPEMLRCRNSRSRDCNHHLGLTTLPQNPTPLTLLAIHMRKTCCPKNRDQSPSLVARDAYSINAGIC